jgi:hypothetical protein
MSPPFPSLPPSNVLPWSADVVSAHQGLSSAYLASQRALKLDESDPIRLGHHLKQAETFMRSIVDALACESANPLPDEHIGIIRELVDRLAVDLRVAHKQATVA